MASVNGGHVHKHLRGTTSKGLDADRRLLSPTDNDKNITLRVHCTDADPLLHKDWPFGRLAVGVRFGCKEDGESVLLPLVSFGHVGHARRR